jgi:hypothetical protein
MLHFEPPLFNQAKADAPPTGLVRVFVDADVPSFAFSPDVDLRKRGSLLSGTPALLVLRFPSSKKRDWPVVVTGDEDRSALLDDAREVAFIGRRTLIPVSRLW